MINKHDLTVNLNHIILIEGFQKLSMSKMATAVGVSRATLYLYFKNKDEVIQAVVARHFQFMTENPIPRQFSAASFSAVWLNSLLLMGATTETFMSDLRHNYPDLAQRLTQTYQDYFAQLVAYVDQAQTADFVLATYQADFVVFQAQTLVKGILQQVRAHQITLSQAETYLDDGITMQLHGLLTPAALQQLDTSAEAPFKAVIFAEFRATYALIM
ncbi:TetR/AcrR family transcriptional regulator [Lactiplantibacillus plantarum]|uniref:TetR/AcrR family transcriptional regulator n=1 Tax=Lactiplantibacillus plantarum TaxID=1590 RepID=UPI0021A5AD59|nr:TetR/AcrR family transcriptional regulator [Lactiplantibacillus plantarum]MCT3247813.1 TetR/AcrR family transcriptional regulator [Lactiplantibacillus plantarum]